MSNAFVSFSYLFHLICVVIPSRSFSFSRVWRKRLSPISFHCVVSILSLLPGLSLTSGGPCSAFLAISNAYFFHSPHHYSSSLACSPLYPVYHPPMPILSLSHAHVITLLCPLYHHPIPTISPYKAAKNTRKTNYKVIVKSHVIPPPKAKGFHSVNKQSADCNIKQAPSLAS